MAPELTHAEIEELLGAYALDAVDTDERVVIEGHLLDCPRCRAEVAEHREAATLLSFAGTAAPEAVWSRIAAGLEEPPPPLALRRAARRPGRARSLPARLAVAAVAATAVAAALIGVLAVQVVRQDRRIDRLAAIAEQGPLDRAAAAAVVAPEARTVRLASDGGAQGADAVVLADGQGYLLRARLPRLDEGRTYQLWGVMGGRAISLGVLGGDPGVTPFKAVGPLTALAITAERSGGAVAPTSTPVVQGPVNPA